MIISGRREVSTAIVDEGSELLLAPIPRESCVVGRDGFTEAPCVPLGHVERSLGRPAVARDGSRTDMSRGPGPSWWHPGKADHPRKNDKISRIFLRFCRGSLITKMEGRDDRPRRGIYASDETAQEYEVTIRQRYPAEGLGPAAGDGGGAQGPRVAASAGGGQRRRAAALIAGLLRGEESPPFSTPFPRKPVIRGKRLAFLHQHGPPAMRQERR